MPKRKESQLPTIKIGTNGDYFCYFAGRKVYLGRNPRDAKAKLVQVVSQDIQSRNPVCKSAPGRSMAGNSVSFDAFGGETRPIVNVDEILLDFLKINQFHRDVSKIKRVFRLVHSMYGDMPAQEFGQCAFQSVRKKLIAENLSYSYINDLMGFVRNAFQLGVENRKLPEQVYFFLMILRPLRRGEAKTLPPRLDVPDAEIVKTLPFLGETVRDMVILQRISGMRPSEMFRLRGCDLDRSGDVWIYSPKGKTARFGIERTIAFGRIEQEILERRMKDRKPGELIFRPADAVRDRYGDDVHIDKRRTRQLKESYGKDSYRRAVTRAIQRARENGVEVQHWTPYQLRHASATFISLAMSREAAATLLGHTTTQTTKGYDHSARQKVIETVRRRDQIVGAEIERTFGGSLGKMGGGGRSGG